ncbi:MAG: cytochrome c biogenesis protein CcsA, partial [Chitinophagaceae bacterium]|nr:cytochrome c biogenesis protein CcsA [Chitinophagaceae bacterium]
AALWKNDFEEWIMPNIRWSLFSAMILGVGIMMGGAWAYDSLSFGGYWAWDPVENSSLVPWLVMIAGLHTVIIYKATSFSLRTTLLFFILSFCFVLYSTFLTRTGILGDTSVHAFTGEGNTLFLHLVIFLFTFLGIGLFLLIKRYAVLPQAKKEEEELSSREFWMFIGALILIISVVQITYTTSMPVWNKMFDTKLVITDPIPHYNKIQVWIGIFIALLTASIYYLKFKISDWKKFLKAISLPFILSLLFGGIIIYTQKIVSWQVAMLLVSAVFAVLANGFYLAKVQKTNWIKWGGNLAHLGFGLMLVGIVLSSYNKKVISVNRLGVDFNLGKETAAENKKESRENVLLFKGIPVKMDKYFLTYLGDTVDEPNHFYNIEYIHKEGDTGKILERFVLSPNAQINPKMGLITNPSTKHYWHKDIFTYVTSTIDKSKMQDTNSYKTQRVSKGDTVFFANGYMIFDGLNNKVDNKNYKNESGDIAISAKIKIFDLEKNQSEVNPVYFIRGNAENFVIDTNKKLNLFVKLNKIFPNEKDKNIELAYKQPSAMDDYVIMKALVFPYINVLWLGIIIMTIGFLLTLYKRILNKKL